MLQQQSEKILWFSEMAECAGNLYLWQYSRHWKLVESSCPASTEKYWDTVFRTVQGPENIEPKFSRSGYPVIFNAAIDLLWITVPSWERNAISSYYVLGPVFLSSMTAEELNRELDAAGLSPAARQEYRDQLEQLPAIQYPTFLLYGSMLYHCFNRDTMDFTDYQVASPKNVRARPEDRFSCDLLVNSSHGRADVEDLLLQQITNGNLNYRSVLPALQLGQYGELAPQSTLRQLKDECLIAITLCSRAAILGGLSRRTALSVGDNYIRQVESSNTINEVMAIYTPMVEDFIKRVHNAQEQQQYSAAVRNCMDYIERHISEPITVKSVAEGTGYTGYYLSGLFRRETGSSIGGYIKNRKIEYAKRLLKETNDNIGSISEQLGFSSPSHFSSVFRSLTGYTPKEFREGTADIQL